MSSMGRATRRLGSQWKLNTAEVISTDSLISIPEEAPQVNLAPVDTQLNMHRFNTLFEEEMAVEGPKDSHNSPAQAPTLTSPRLSNEAPAEWSAVGHAAATGKSGRVIHNLQEEVARLKRDSALWQSRAEESQRTSEALKIQMEEMADWLRHKEQVNETSLKSIDRKNRKIEELRAELHAERTKRHDAQIVANETNEAMRVERQNHNRETARLQEEAKYFKNQYEVLSSATKRDKADLERRVDKAWEKVNSIAETSSTQGECAKRLMVIGDQKNREIDGLYEVYNKAKALHADYKETKDKEFRGTIDRAHANNALIDSTLKELKETQDKMKWVIRMSELNESKKANEQAQEQTKEQPEEKPTPQPPSS
ncbi:mother-specific HO expression [Penicillium ochrochloron]